MSHNMQGLRIELFTGALPGFDAVGDQMAQWIYDEFIHNIRKGVSLADVRSRFKNCAPGVLPLRFAAYAGETLAGTNADALVGTKSDVLVGTISLVQNDLMYRAYSPWLSSLYVDPAYRSRGYARAMIERVKEEAWALGYKKLYLRTEHAGGYYRKLGWAYVEQCGDEYGLEPEVFCWTH